MTDLKPLKNESTRFTEPLRSIIEISKDSMPEQEFIDFFIGLRKKARELDIKQREEVVK